LYYTNLNEESEIRLELNMKQPELESSRLRCFNVAISTPH